MEEKKSVNVFNLIILDESGSMSSIYNETLSAINETLSGIRKIQQEHPEQHHYVSIITFEGNGKDSVKTRRDRVAIDEIQDFTTDDYRPGGCTPLYDAMGYSITALDKNISADDFVMATIITDGYENASKEYSGIDIKELVSRQREKGWTFAYIGANQDSIVEARKLNISNALNFKPTKIGMMHMIRRFDQARANFAANVSCSLEEDAAPMSFEALFDDDENKD